MKKNFDSWNNKKKEINDKSQNRFYHPREAWWCSLGINIGFEQDGTSGQYQRPVLIIRAFNRHVCLIVPLTTSAKKNKYHVSLRMIKGKEAFAIISQLRLIDTKRFTDRLAVVDKQVFDTIKNAVRDLI